MSHIPMPELLPCPFCGADAAAGWVAHERDGKSWRVSCSREGECPSPEWVEAAGEHEDDAACVASVCGFWNTRSEDWSENGWTRSGPKPKEPVLVYTIQRAAERNLADAIGAEAIPHQPYAVARWQKGQWRDVRDGRIYRAQAWRRLSAPGWL